MNFDFRGVATGNAIAQRSHQNHVSPGAPPHTMENSPLRTGESYASINATGRQDVESRSPPEGTAGRTGPRGCDERGDNGICYLGAAHAVGAADHGGTAFHRARDAEIF